MDQPAENKSPKLIVGLGNPGARYQATRHNLGFMVTAALAKELGLDWVNEGSSYVASRWSGDPDECVLLQPQTYMNLSGEAVSAWLEHHGFASVGSRILVVCDDLALPLGTLRMRSQGSSGGQNGLASVIEHLQTEDFPRLRLGIDATEGELSPEDWADYVLTNFSEVEQDLAVAMVEKSVQAVRSWLEIGAGRTASRFNGLVSL